MAQDLNRPASPPPSRPGVRVGCVLSTYHLELTGAMAQSAKRELESAGMASEDWIEIQAPGAFELPLIARRLAEREDIDCVLAFGLVLTGETNHDVYVSHAAAEGLLLASLEVDKPILFGVLTCQTLHQAQSRALPPDQGGKQDKGREVAQAALATLAALDQASAATSSRASRPT